MTYFKKLTAILLIFLIVFSCQENSPTEPNKEEPSNSSGQPMPDFSETSNLNGLLATIYYEFDTGVPGFPSVGLAMGYAQFGTMINGGTVSVNNNDLGKSTQGANVFYMNPGPGSTDELSNVNFNGSLHQWNVTGNGDIPPFQGGLESPSLFNVTAPQNNSTISKTADLNITWSRTGFSDEKILINLISLSNSKNIVSEQGLSNSGSYKIDKSKLNSISGKVMVQIVKYRYKEISANNKVYLIVSEIVKSLNLTVN